MKKITRRLAAALLCALLVLCAPFAAALTGAAGAQVQIWLADGTGQTLPVQIVTTSLGDVVYWLDQTQLTDEQRAALPGGTLVLTDAEGNARFTIEAAGEYLISARSDSAILVPPVCIVTVK